MRVPRIVYVFRIVSMITVIVIRQLRYEEQRRGPDRNIQIVASVVQVVRRADDPTKTTPGTHLGKVCWTIYYRFRLRQSIGFRSIVKHVNGFVRKTNYVCKTDVRNSRTIMTLAFAGLIVRVDCVPVIVLDYL